MNKSFDLIVNVPIESLVDRYSHDWNLAFPTELGIFGPVHTVYPAVPVPDKVVDGEFLNTVDSNLFKAAQLQDICSLFQQGRITDDTVFFFHDLWFPGLEMLFYIRDASGIKFKISGMFHAGTWDDHDFLSKKGMGQWARSIEATWASNIDLPLVSTSFHHRLMENKLCLFLPNLRVAPFPLWNLNREPIDFSKKEKIIVFPHRQAAEKNFEEFEALQYNCKSHFPGWQFVMTTNVCKNKQEYYELLKRSTICVSLSQQETWGIAQLEATAAGCLPLVPNALSYPELYPSRYRYKVKTDANLVPVSVSHNDLRPALERLIRSIENKPEFNQREAQLLQQFVLNRTSPSHILQALSTL